MTVYCHWCGFKIQSDNRHARRFYCDNRCKRADEEHQKLLERIEKIEAKLNEVR